MKLSPSTIAANLSAAAAAEAEITQAVNSNNQQQPNQTSSMTISSSSTQSSLNQNTIATTGATNIQNQQHHHQASSNVNISTGTGNSAVTTTGSHQTQSTGTAGTGTGQQTMNQTNQQSANSKLIPKDSQVVAAILKEMGITDYEPRVLPQLVEFAYRYVSRVLEDAQLFSSYAKKKVIDTDDASLAIQMQIDRSFVGPPSRDILLEISRNKNTQPLPPIKSHNGMRLPADRYSLVAPNFRLVSKNNSNQNSSTNLPQTTNKSFSLLSTTHSFMNSKLTGINSSSSNSPINTQKTNNNNALSQTLSNDVFGSKRKLED